MKNKELKKIKYSMDNYSSTTSMFKRGYNQACDEWEAYHKQEMNKRPSLSVEEIEKVLRSISGNTLYIAYSQFKELALAIKEKMEGGGVMNVYEIEALGCYSQRHCVVAESYEIASKLWKQKYKSEPKSITLFSEYVIIQEPTDEQK